MMRPQSSGGELSAAADGRREPASVQTRNLTVVYGSRPIIEDAVIDVPGGRVTSIIGANACGKSTLLKSLSRVLTPSSGHVLLDGRDIHTMPTRQLARELGLLPQHPVCPEGITVGDLVGRGRNPHQRLFRMWSAEDADAVDEALRLTATREIADRNVDELSGGQRQRVWIAMALAQRTDVLLLDEPITYLDVAHQLEILDMLIDLNRQRGTTIAMVLHDINLAARYSDCIIAMRSGKVIAEGAPHDVITEETIREVFSLESEVLDDPVSGLPMILPKGRHFIR